MSVMMSRLSSRKSSKHAWPPSPLVPLNLISAIADEEAFVRHCGAPCYATHTCFKPCSRPAAQKPVDILIMQVPTTTTDDRPVSPSGYEDLSLDDDGPDQARDPWASPAKSEPKHDFTTSRFSAASSSFATSPSRSSSTSQLGMSGAGRPGLGKHASTSASTVTSGRAQDCPLVLGVAVVDFNHLVSPLPVHTCL